MTDIDIKKEEELHDSCSAPTSLENRLQNASSPLLLHEDQGVFLSNNHSTAETSTIGCSLSAEEQEGNNKEEGSQPQKVLFQF